MSVAAGWASREGRATPRAEASFPVQYLGANVPQAWAASSILRFVAILAGIDASASPDGRSLYVDPALPAWLPELRIENLRAGTGAVTLAVRGDEVTVERNTSGYEVVRGPAPLVAGRA